MMRMGSQRNFVSRFCLALIACLIATLFSLHAAEVMPIKPTHYFTDEAHVVSADIGQQLEQKLENFERETSDQVLVSVYPKMQTDSSIEDYTQRLAQKWQVGQKDKN